jgi:hypothetical protein
MKSSKLALPAVAAAITLGACDGYDDGGGYTPPPPPPPAMRLEDQFGAAFGVAFRAAPSSDPADPRNGDTIPLSLTTDPVEIPNPR